MGNVRQLRDGLGVSGRESRLDAGGSNSASAVLGHALFAATVDLAAAERNAEPSDKWYGNWDDTHEQYEALSGLDAKLGEATAVEVPAIFDEYRFWVRHHLDSCPTTLEDSTAASATSRAHAPFLDGMERHLAAALRDRAADIRRGEGEPGLTGPAREALARVYEAHADLGELLWGEEGREVVRVDGIPGW